MIADIPSRGLLGLLIELISETNGDIKIESDFLGYEEYRGSLDIKRKNFLIASTGGKVTSYGMKDLMKFGVFFIKP